MKMKLQLDDLQVESFAVAPELAEYGTVKGYIFAEAAPGSGIHTQCYTHCASGCEGSCTCPSQAPTHRVGDSCDGSCDTVATAGVIDA